MDYKEIVENLVNKGADNIKKKTVILNDNKPILEKEDFNVIEGNPINFKIKSKERYYAKYRKQ